MPLQVIGAGYGRTGTMSLKLALERLGLAPCHHMMEVFMHPEQKTFWEDAAMGRPVEWEDLFKNYRASCDWPSSYFYRELAERYPDAKVILTTRDPHAWYKSISSTIFKFMQRAANPPPGEEPPINAVFAKILIADGTFNNRYDESHVLNVLAQHEAEVKRMIAPQRLLVYDTKEGWEPLCEFLDAAVPDVPFPRTNSTDEFLARATTRFQQR